MAKYKFRYGWFFIGAIVVLCLPFLVNYLILRPRKFDFVGADVDWLSFWGSYLSSIVSAGVAFIILFIQRKDNEKQNEQNRVENQCENNNNRTLQLNILKYQQQSHWLDIFRAASLDYCHTFNNNDVIMVANIMWDNPKGAFDLLKSLYNRMIATEAKFSFVRKQDEKTNVMVNDITIVYKEYRQILDDLQWIVLYFIETVPAARHIGGFNSFLQARNYNVSPKMAPLLHHQPIGINNRAYFNFIFQNVSQGFELFESKVRDQLYDYIKLEQSSIDNILTENLK